VDQDEDIYAGTLLLNPATMISATTIPGYNFLALIPLLDHLEDFSIKEELWRDLEMKQKLINQSSMDFKSSGFTLKDSSSKNCHKDKETDGFQKYIRKTKNRNIGNNSWAITYRKSR